MRFPVLAAFTVTLAVGLLVSRAEAQAASFTCTVLENGQRAQGTFAIVQNGAEVAQGTCGTPVSVPAGASTVTVQLDGALDAPREAQDVVFRAGQTERVSISFTTGTLLVACEGGGRRAAGRVTLYRDGRQVAELGSGVEARLSTGAYEVVVKHRTEEQRFQVNIETGRVTQISATF